MDLCAATAAGKPHYPAFLTRPAFGCYNKTGYAADDVFPYVLAYIGNDVRLSTACAEWLEMARLFGEQGRLIAASYRGRQSALR